ncbi:uncharacterized protein LOC117650683 [Thrips palmi]|uniref:Uncharacterized protein LOC117650683 n=1 Tax=Thrips palmi TaxID=161013 RepID=A0A6P8ZXK7_THRPL|nr:uncharacterized protein LOC117650683 [Thrips palmi]
MEETRIARNLLFGTDLRPGNLASTDFWPRGPPLLLLKSFQRMRLKKANLGLTYASLEEAESMLVPLGGLQLLPLPELVGMLRILFLLPLPELGRRNRKQDREECLRENFNVFLDKHRERMAAEFPDYSPQEVEISLRNLWNMKELDEQLRYLCGFNVE